MNPDFNDAFKTALEAFVARQQAVINEHEKRFAHRENNTLSYEVGKRYVRLVVGRKNGEDGTFNSRSAYGFVDLQTGNILKAASWKAPATNFPRGNLFSAEAKKFSPYGIS